MAILENYYIETHSMDMCGHPLNPCKRDSASTESIMRTFGCWATSHNLCDRIGSMLQDW